MLFPWEWLKVGQGTAKYHIKKDGRNIFQLCTVSAFLKYSARKWYKTNFQVQRKIDLRIIVSPTRRMIQQH